MPDQVRCVPFTEERITIVSVSPQDVPPPLKLIVPVFETPLERVKSPVPMLRHVAPAVTLMTFVAVPVVNKLNDGP